jgi:hypothetical protein
MIMTKCKRQILSTVLFIVFISSCADKDQDIEKTKSVLTCEAFSSLDVEISSIDMEGVAAQMDLSEYQFSHVIERIGFTYKMQNDTREFRVFTDAELTEGVLKMRIEKNLLSGKVYEIKGVVLLGGKECFSKSTLFESKGSKTIENEPFTCPSFANLIPKINETNDEGITIALALPLYTSFDNVQNYGFIYRAQGSNEMYTITLPNDLTTANFTTKVNENLVCGLPYEIWAFATIDNVQCKSQTITFISQGSSQASPWCALVYEPYTGFDNSFGITINHRPYVIFQDNAFYEIDTINSTLVKRNRFPLA